MVEAELDEQTVQGLQDRLARIEGQVRGIRRMLGEHRQCHEVLTQVLAAHAALERVAGEMVNASLEECLLLPPEEARAIISANVRLLAHI